MAVVASTSALLSSAFFRFIRLFHSQELRSFSNLPDDVILEVFTCMDFSSIIALRQTCRKCYRVSKTTALWLDVYRWITKDAEDWRMPLAESHLTLPADDLERAATRLVRFERNWSRGHKGVQRTASFPLDRSYAFTFVPGGRWYLASTRHGTRGVVCYDLDALDIQGRMLITQEHQGQEIWGMDSAVDTGDGGVEFNLAVEFITLNQFQGDNSEPRNLTVWRVSLDTDNHLSAKLVRSIPVFRSTPLNGPISLVADGLLRLSTTLSRHPVFTVYRWNVLNDGQVTPSILIPMRRFMPKSGVRLLPDGRVLSISDSWVEIYAPPDYHWEESSVFPKDIPRSTPQWVYEYAPPLYRKQHGVSQLVYSPIKAWVTLSIHNGEHLLNFRIPVHGGLEPEVTPAVFAQMGAEAKVGLGTSRAIISTLDESQATAVTLDYRPGMESLRRFAGVPPDGNGSVGHNRVAETRFESPYTSKANPWLIDEKSGRVVCLLATEPDQHIVFYFVD